MQDLPPKVILVHGTYAQPEDLDKSNQSDKKGRWYRPISSFFSWLKQILLFHGKDTQSVELDNKESNTDEKKISWYRRGSDFVSWLTNEGIATPSDTLSWDGLNSETSRITAATELVDKILEFERHSERYYLIGHSHGGSVIWAALRMVETKKYRKKIPNRDKSEPVLKHLQNWITVGTPFLYGKRTIYGEILAFIFQLAVLFWVLYELININIDFVASVPAWLSVASIVMVVYCIFRLVVNIPILKAGRTMNQRYFKKSTKEYQRKWIGLYSKQDEAIAGLKHAIGLKEKFVKPIQHRDIPYLDSTAVKIRRYIFWTPTKIFNWFLAPLANIFVTKQIRQLALGDDEPLYKIRRVELSPMADEEFIPKSLPDSIDESIINDANNALKEFVPTIRSALSRGVTFAGTAKENIAFEIESQKLTWNELVHTSYFDNEGFRQLLKLILQGNNKNSDAADLSEFEKWISEFQASLDTYLQSKKSSVFENIYWLLPALIFVTAVFLTTYIFYPDLYQEGLEALLLSTGWDI